MELKDTMTVEHRPELNRLNQIIEYAQTRPITDGDRRELHAIRNELAGLHQRTSTILNKYSPETLRSPLDTSVIDLTRDRLRLKV